MVYEFPQANLLIVTEHALALDIEIDSLTLNSGTYRMTTASAFPADQLEHLDLVEV